MASCTEKHNTVGHSIGRMLLRHGIHEFFGQGLPQGLSLPFEELGLRQIAYRTENGGGYMADGYARVSKRPGVMIAQNGPAATLVVAPPEALKSSIVVMLREIPLKNEDRNAFQEFDHVRLFSACSKWTRRVITADRVEDYVNQAFAVACSGRPGPVVLLFPNDMLGMPAEPEKRDIPLGHYPLNPVMPPLDAVRGVAERLLSSRNPCDRRGRRRAPLLGVRGPCRASGTFLPAGGDHGDGQGRRGRTAPALAQVFANASGPRFCRTPSATHP